MGAYMNWDSTVRPTDPNSNNSDPIDSQPTVPHSSQAPVAPELAPNDLCPADSGPDSSPRVANAVVVPQEFDRGQTVPSRDTSLDSPEPDHTQSLPSCGGVDSHDPNVLGVESNSSVRPQLEEYSRDPATCVNKDSTHLQRSQQINFGMRPLQFRQL